MVRIQCQPLQDGLQQWVYQPSLATPGRKIHYKANRIKESAKCLDNIRCQQSKTGFYLCSETTTVLSE